MATASVGHPLAQREARPRYAEGAHAARSPPAERCAPSSARRRYPEVRLHVLLELTAVCIRVALHQRARKRRRRPFHQPRRQLERHDRRAVVDPHLAVGPSGHRHRPAQAVVAPPSPAHAGGRPLADDHLSRVEAVRDLLKVLALRAPHRGVRHLVHRSLALREVPVQRGSSLGLRPQQSNDRDDLPPRCTPHRSHASSSSSVPRSSWVSQLHAPIEVTDTSSPHRYAAAISSERDPDPSCDASLVRKDPSLDASNGDPEAHVFGGGSEQLSYESGGAFCVVEVPHHQPWRIARSRVVARQLAVQLVLAFPRR